MPEPNPVRWFGMGTGRGRGPGFDRGNLYRRCARSILACAVVLAGTDAGSGRQGSQVCLQVVVNLIGTVTTRKGLKIRASLDPGEYKTGAKVKD